MAAIATEIELPAPPDAPGVFRFATPGVVSEMFEAAGLQDVREVDVRDELLVSSAAKYWEFVTEIAAPVVAGLAQVDDAARERIRALALERVCELELDGQPRFPLHARCVVATR